MRSRASGMEFEATCGWGLQGRDGTRSGGRAAQPPRWRQSGDESAPSFRKDGVKTVLRGSP
eukprot:7184323-Alexandrium_andersonii.AAC.1